MTELPQTQDLPHAEEGYDPARVEEAFTAFADRVRELETIAAELRSELQALRAERPFAARREPEDWPADPSLLPAGSALSPEWIAAVPPPIARAFAVPRLALEALFLVVVALLAGLADLSAGLIVVVMAVAWALVALAEWAAAAKRARWRLDEIPPALESELAAGGETGPWDMPIVQATVVDPGPDPESKTVVTKLPVDPVESAAVEETPPEAEPKRRWWSRRKPAEAPPADPWEA